MRKTVYGEACLVYNVEHFKYFPVGIDKVSLSLPQTAVRVSLSPSVDLIVLKMCIFLLLCALCVFN